MSNGGKEYRRQVVSPRETEETIVMGAWLPLVKGDGQDLIPDLIGIAEVVLGNASRILPLRVRKT